MNNNKLANSLDGIARGWYWDESALKQALTCPGLKAEEIRSIKRYLNGSHDHWDCRRLQDIAITIRTSQEEI